MPNRRPTHRCSAQIILNSSSMTFIQSHRCVPGWRRADKALRIVAKSCPQRQPDIARLSIHSGNGEMQLRQYFIVETSTKLANHSAPKQHYTGLTTNLPASMQVEFSELHQQFRVAASRYESWNLELVAVKGTSSGCPRSDRLCRILLGLASRQSRTKLRPDVQRGAGPRQGTVDPPSRLASARSLPSKSQPRVLVR